MGIRPQTAPTEYPGQPEWPGGKTKHNAETPRPACSFPPPTTHAANPYAEHANSVTPAPSPKSASSRTYGRNTGSSEASPPSSENSTQRPSTAKPHPPRSQPEPAGAAEPPNQPQGQRRKTSPLTRGPANRAGQQPTPPETGTSETRSCRPAPTAEPNGPEASRNAHGAYRRRCPTNADQRK